MNIDLSKLDQLPKEQQDILLDLVSQYEQTKNQEEAGEDFLSFVKQMWIAFIEGYHHKIMSDAFNRVKDGKLKRLIINMPPRHTKSEFASYLLPAWFLGCFPR